VPSGAGAGYGDVLSLFLRLLPLPFLDDLRRQCGLRQNNRVYTVAVVLWLFVLQRLLRHASMETVVCELLRTMPEAFWPRPCKRLRQHQQHHQPLSSHDGGYNLARQRLPLPLVENSCDRIFEQLSAQYPGRVPALGVRAFIFDGTSVTAPAIPSLLDRYPPARNQHGPSHWPTLRLLVAHDLQTGLALRPVWGPMYGAEPVSEQGLLERALERLPTGAVMVADTNFGVFSVVYPATQHHHPVIVRLEAARAKRLLPEPLRDGIDQQVKWKPSRAELRKHPELPPDSCIEGRVIVRQVQPSNGAPPFLLALFTTLDLDADPVLEVYGQRWDIETDLRTLKRTLDLDQLSCATPEMVAKELNLAIAAYNLVRAVISLAAEGSGLPPRSYSFSRVRNVITAFGPAVAAAASPEEAQKQFNFMMYYVGQCTLRSRRGKRKSYPRAVWGKRKTFPHRAAKPEQKTMGH
jgi:hypothetical protein